MEKNDVTHERSRTMPLPRFDAELFEKFFHSLARRPLLEKRHEEVRLRSAKRQSVSALLDELKIRADVSRADVERVPTQGPVVLVSNRPFGTVDGLVLLDTLLRVRSDVRVLANSVFAAVPAIAEYLIGLETNRVPKTKTSNAAALHRALEFVRLGGALVVFPTEELPRLHLRPLRIAKAQWPSHVGWLVRKAQAAVVPMCFPGLSPPVVQGARLVHPALRGLLVWKELRDKAGSSVRLTIGHPVPFPRLATYLDDRELTEHLCQRTLILSSRHAEYRRLLRRVRTENSTPSPVASEENRQAIAAELAALPSSRKLEQLGDLSVYLARGDELPRTLPEIGRLRELTFRAVGEGTGNPRDIDAFDPHYLQLVLWNEAKHEVAGGYRLGVAEATLRVHGVSGLYTSTLFRFSPEILKQFSVGLEIGRSFVRPEYQRALAPLLLLWKGIGRYVVKHPWTPLLFGPVSISADYTLASRALIVSYLAQHHLDENNCSLVSPLHPFKPLRTKDFDADKTANRLKSFEDLSRLICDLEPDGKTVPMLIGHYLKLGAKVLGFNVDPAFGHVVDALIVVDLRQTEPRLLSRYMGPQGCGEFLAYHGQCEPRAS